MDNVRTAQGRAWNYVSADDMQNVQGVIVRESLSSPLTIVNNPNGVHIRSNGHVVTVKGFDKADTVTIDYRSGGGIVGVIMNDGVHSVRLLNFGEWAPRGIQQIHLCAINNS